MNDKRRLTAREAAAWIDAMRSEGWTTVWAFKPNGLLGGGRRGWYRRSDNMREMTVQPDGRHAWLYLSPIRWNG
jgi:hypothetical protein